MICCAGTIQGGHGLIGSRSWHSKQMVQLYKAVARVWGNQQEMAKQPKVSVAEGQHPSPTALRLKSKQRSVASAQRGSQDRSPEFNLLPMSS